MALLESALSSLNQRDGVQGVLLCHLQPADLTAHLLRNGETRSVVTRPVDPETRGKLLDGLGDAALVDDQLTMGVHRHQVVGNTHCCILLDGLLRCLPLATCPLSWRKRVTYPPPFALLF